MESIPKDACIEGMAYALKSRNLQVGVWTGNGFVGIREKFDREYLFMEFHWDDGPPFGTVSPQRELGMCPVKNLSEYLPLVCSCGRPAERRIESRRHLDPTGQHEVPEDAPGYWREFGWMYHDDGSRLPHDHSEHSAMRPMNQELFDWLKPLDDEEGRLYAEEWARWEKEQEVL